MQDPVYSDFEEKLSYALVLIQSILETRRKHVRKDQFCTFRNRGVHSVLKDLTEPWPLSLQNGLGEISSRISQCLLWSTGRSTCMPLLVFTRIRPCAFQISRKSLICTCPALPSHQRLAICLRAHCWKEERERGGRTDSAKKPWQLRTKFRKSQERLQAKRKMVEDNMKDLNDAEMNHH